MKDQASGILHFYKNLKAPNGLPKGVEVLNPFTKKEVLDINNVFYEKFYSDDNSRYFLVGINPGRLGAGITGLPFTDPMFLEDMLGIKNDFQKKHELSSIFVYDVIEAYGGAEAFYSDFYFTSVSPLGFTRDGKNLNYYDERDLEDALKPYIVDNLHKQVKDLNGQRKVAFCLGQGKNFKYLEKLNKQEGFFEKVLPLPHPRWVMQYRLKRKAEFIDQYLRTFREAGV